MHHQLNQPLNQPYSPGYGAGPVNPHGHFAPPANYAPANPGYIPAPQDNPFGVPQHLPQESVIELNSVKGVQNALRIDLVSCAILATLYLAYYQYKGLQLDLLIAPIIALFALVIVAFNTGYDKVPISMPGYLKVYNYGRLVYHVCQFLGAFLLGCYMIFYLYVYCFIFPSLDNTRVEARFVLLLLGCLILSIVAVVISYFAFQQKASFDQRLECHALQTENPQRHV